MKRVIGLLAAMLLSGCVPPVYQNPYPLGPIALPQDDGAHPAPTEWWYYTGHLTDDEGKDYGFELTFFKVYTPPRFKLLGFIPAFVVAEKGHLAHVAITDKSTNGFEKAEKADFWGYQAGASSSNLNVYVSNWYTKRAADGVSHEIFATLGNRQLKLTLTPEKPAALHGEPPGIQPMGLGGASYYFSYTRLKAAGELSINCTLLGCETLKVTGQAWHDHQWGDFDLLKFAGWDWFSVQFENNTELMLYLIRQPDGSYHSEAGSFINQDGEVTFLEQDDFDLEATGETWQSEVTGAIYPMAWQITVPRYGIDVLVEPVTENQEMNVTGIVYWEGAAKVTGSHAGLGYVELTNYNLYPYGQTDAATPLKPLLGPFGFGQD